MTEAEQPPDSPTWTKTTALCAFLMTASHASAITAAGNSPTASTPAITARMTLLLHRHEDRTRRVHEVSHLSHRPPQRRNRFQAAPAPTAAGPPAAQRPSRHH